MILFRAFGADALEFEIRAYLRDVNYIMKVGSDLHFAVAEKFREAGIEIPFGQRDIWFRNPEALGEALRGAPAPEPPARRLRPAPKPHDVRRHRHRRQRSRVMTETMRTEPLFRDDAYLDRCEATVLAVSEAGVLLDRSVFYPTGGGQPGDAGELRFAGGVCPIATAVKGEGEAILHVPAEGAATPAVGETVEAVIDVATRARYRRVHTALHLLSVVIPLPVNGGQIAAEKGRLDFDMPEPPADKDALEARLNALIAEDHPVSAEWISDAELDANPGLVKTMSVKPPMGAGRVRLIRIGTPDASVDLQPCGGTHVRSTAEIGPVRLGKIEKKGRQNRRVTVFLES
jgi:misacylated tRNA(Ala) deacylase